jgi:ATPase subunit of ABC transporter with duplicated ATPase domains
MREPASDERWATVETSFELAGVEFSVGDRPLVAGLDLTFERGRVYGLIGHNGSGKSTLMKLLARQQTATQGELRYRDRLLGAAPNSRSVLERAAGGRFWFRRKRARY